ncbi:uncharacterized protein CLUP02_10804 [Colletotrichum lupini]|uniref:Uncharacterized protein n=1 Tax=Colletotrichum lupini TaxID=145971 RepID=A0A9Q8SZ63_9PEZI|nr:uncharacterized protein CLUP02_10804 [Colletotrichum lupini]UQC85307.1 hypothetical protein CLUP02_10804 [Colletotrichum lupini]
MSIIIISWSISCMVRERGSLTFLNNFFDGLIAVPLVIFMSKLVEGRIREPRGSPYESTGQRTNARLSKQGYPTSIVAIRAYMYCISGTQQQNAMRVVILISLEQDRYLVQHDSNAGDGRYGSTGTPSSSSDCHHFYLAEGAYPTKFRCLQKAQGRVTMTTCAVNRSALRFCRQHHYPLDNLPSSLTSYQKELP